VRASQVCNVRIQGIASAVPDKVVSWREEIPVFGEVEMRKITENTGIEERRIAPEGICTSDLCIAAAEPLLAELQIDRANIDCVILVTQTPDYFLPATACSIASRLGLSNNCAAFDVNLGCSGYTYGLWMASHLLASGGASRVLLLAGETASRPVHPCDRSARPLFGDAGTATVLETSSDATPIHFRFGTDGSGQNSLIIPAGGERQRRSEQTCRVERGADGNSRTLENLFMDGAEIFSFTIERVPPLLLQTVEDAGWSVSDVDAFVLHQANGFMLKNLARFAGIPLEKVPIALRNFGNTSSASIPLALTTSMRDQMANGPLKLVLAGFGVGFSWCSAALLASGIELLPLVEVDCDRLLNQLYSTHPESKSHLPAELRSIFHAPKTL
jgi:3-oxoacyl-[acyl-carrier-protein] synthase-3